MSRAIRKNLAAAYRIIHLMGYDNLTYTHLSARAEDGKSFYILPFGFLFDEVTASSLLRVDFDGNVLFLRNHGVITCGKTIHAAYIYLHHLQQACKTQCLAMADRENLILPSKEICERSVKDLLSFEPDFDYEK